MSKKRPLHNLHKALKDNVYHHGVMATYMFSARFFEEYALEKFNALQENANVSVLVDHGVFQELLNTSGKAREAFPHRANLRYLLHPIRVRGRFHPKVYLFTRKDRGLLIIGSANLTQDGISSNAELVGIFEFIKDKKEDTQPLFRQAFDYFQKLEARWPSEQLRSNLDALLADTPWVAEDRASPSEELPTFLHNLEEPLWDQILKSNGKTAKSVSVLSRFFDQRPEILNRISENLGTKKIQIYTQNVITTLTEGWLDHPLVKSGDTKISLCRYKDEDHPQPLHAKAILIERQDGASLVFGSANFTTPALLRTTKNGNAEVMLVYPHLGAQQLDPASLFDPDGTAILLKRKEDLHTAEKEQADDSEKESFAISLTEVSLNGERLNLQTRSPTTFPESAAATCILSSPERRQSTLRLRLVGGGHYSADVPAEMHSRLREKATIAQLVIEEQGQTVARSNPALVVNIQDIKTGRDMRRERLVQEARQSPDRFAAVLMDLATNGDEAALLQFLTYCNIPLDQNIRAFRSRSLGKEAAQRAYQAMKDLGPRNLKTFVNLHEAVMDFAQRHRRRLEKHVSSGIVSGIPNFLHILLTICRLLILQIERVVAGLEGDAKISIKTDEWFAIRETLNAYFEELLQLLDMTVVEYISEMLGTYPEAEVRAQFAPDLDDVALVYDKMLALRDSVDGLKEANLQILGAGGALVKPSYFKSVLAPAKWVEFSTNVIRLKAQMTERLAG